MNTNQIKQRLIEAALTEDIPATPTFQMPGRVARHQERRETWPQKNWIGYAAAACIAIAITVAIPVLSHRDGAASTANMLLTTDDPAIELEYAFSMVNEHFAMSDNLLK